MICGGAINKCGFPLNLTLTTCPSRDCSQDAFIQYSPFPCAGTESNYYMIEGIFQSIRTTTNECPSKARQTVALYIIDSTGTAVEEFVTTSPSRCWIGQYFFAGSGQSVKFLLKGGTSQTVIANMSASVTSTTGYGCVEL